MNFTCLMCMSLILLENLCSISPGFAFFFQNFLRSSFNLYYLQIDDFVYFFFLFYIEFILMQKAYLDSVSLVVT